MSIADIRIAKARSQAADWEMVKDAVEQQEDPHRDRMVVFLGEDYVATYRWEVNPTNGYVTVQLKDGSIIPVRLGKWCLYSCATDYFGIERSEITVDDPDKG